MPSRIKLNVSEDELLTAQQVLINPLNSSVSKQQFSFPKAERWRSTKTQQSDYHFYDLPSTKTKQVTTIGKSKRSTFNQKFNSTPGPNIYNYIAEGEFGGGSLSNRKLKQKGMAFGLGRSEIKVNNFIDIKNIGPGPQKYCPNPENYQRRSPQKFIFPKEKKFMSQKKVQLTNLGPGSYNIRTSVGEQNKILSTDQKSLCPKITQIKVDCRKTKPIDITPLYQPKITSKGQKLDFINPLKAPRIGNSKRQAMKSKLQTPGPGRYKVFSQFLSKSKK